MFSPERLLKVSELPTAHQESDGPLCPRSGLYIVLEIPEACILMPVALTSMLSDTFVETLVDIQTVQIINTI